MPGMERPIREHVPLFIAARRYSVESRRHRSVVLNRFADLTGNPRPADLTVDRCLDWWANLGDLAPATLHAYFRVVRIFVRHLHTLGYLDDDPLAAIEPPTVPRVEPVVLTDAEVAAVTAACRTTEQWCVIGLMLGSGLRAVDVARLDVPDIDLAAGVMRVQRKGNTVDHAGMPAAVVDAVAAHIRGRTEGPVVPLGDRRSTPRRISDIANGRLRVAGVKRCAFDGRSGHVLRRTCATTLLEGGATVVEVQAQLGHSSLSSTQRYLARPNAARLRAVVERGPLSMHSA